MKEEWRNRREYNEWDTN